MNTTQGKQKVDNYKKAVENYKNETDKLIQDAESTSKEAVD